MVGPAGGPSSTRRPILSLQALPLKSCLDKISLSTSMAVLSMPVRAKHEELTDVDMPWMSKWLRRPLDVVKQTITCTSRRLKAYFSYPMKKHYQARFSWISDYILRLNEIVSTDTIFLSEKGFQGEQHAQVQPYVPCHRCLCHEVQEKVLSYSQGLHAGLRCILNHTTR